MNSKTPRSFALVSPCGLGNLGDAAIQKSMITAIRRRFPDARIFGITLNPKDTVSRHGIPSISIQANFEQDYSVLGIPEAEAARSATLPAGSRSNEMQNPEADSSGGYRRLYRRLLPRWLRNALWGLRNEASHFKSGYDLLRGVDTLVFSGGGQLDDFWGGHWAHPYALLKWTVLARLANAKVLFLSVGFGTLNTRLSRLFTRGALSMAWYRSYRDEGSRELMRKAGFRKLDPVYPDLAFGLAPASQTGFESISNNDGQVVLVSPIAYCNPEVWAIGDQRRWESYRTRLVEALVWLVSTGMRLVLATTDGPDRRVLPSVIRHLDRQLASCNGSKVRVPDISTVADFQEMAGSAAVVVASRLHGVLLSQLSGTPVLALSYERKVDVLMTEMSQAELCLDIDTFDLETFQIAYKTLVERRDSLRRQITSQVVENRKRVEQQYDRVLEGPALNGPVKPVGI